MLDITQKLQTLMHVRSTYLAPQTSREIEILREAQATIKQLRIERWTSLLGGFMIGAIAFMMLYLYLTAVL